MILPFRGGCACGALRYECSAAPLFRVHCHCRDCQRASGTAFSSALAVPVAAVHIDGVAKHHEVRAASGHTARRGFCPECGSPVFASNSGSPELLAMLTQQPLRRHPDKYHAAQERSSEQGLPAVRATNRVA